LPFQRNVDAIERAREEGIKSKVPYRLFSYYVQNKNYDKAENLALDMLEKNPGDILIIHNLTSVYSKIGENEKAIDFLLKILETNPAHSTARIGLSSLYEKKGDYQKAVEQLEILKFYETQKSKIDNQIRDLKKLQALKESKES
jgi:tetratricopeptide (TPR) repeat protein